MSKFISNAFQVPNSVIDDLMANLSPNSLKCYLLVVRKTTGWGKESDCISESQFMEKTGIKNVKTVRSALNELCELGLINQFKKRGQITEYSLVLDSENQYQKTVVPKNGTSTKNYPQPVPKNGTSTKNYPQPVPKIGSEPVPKIGTLQKTITKTTKQNTDARKSSLAELDFSVFGEITQEQIQEIIRIRKINTKKSSTQLSQNVLNLLAKEFIDCGVRFGMSISDCLGEWELRGWQGFKAAWIDRSIKQQVPSVQATASAPSESQSIKNEIKRLEREADAIGIQISQSKSWGATKEAIQSFERQQATIIAKRSELIQQLGGEYGQ